jgi:hypothetical protein
VPTISISADNLTIGERLSQIFHGKLLTVKMPHPEMHEMLDTHIGQSQPDDFQQFNEVSNFV